MREIPIPAVTVTRSAAAHGWVRCRALDTETSDCWEMPNGNTVAVSKGVTPMLTTLLPMRDIPNAP